MVLPAHPLLAPGVRVTRRGDGLLQVGLERPVVTADSPAARAALTALEAGHQPDPHDLESARLVRDLLAAGLIVDGDLLLADLGSAPAHASYALETEAVLALRASQWVEVVGPSEWAGLAESWLPAGPGGAVGTPAVTLVVAVGVQSREHVDELVRLGRPHLLVGTVEGRVELGPFVHPGTTACLRCVDAHRGEHDPRRSLVIEQYAASGPRVDGVPEPVDEPVLTAALAWAARDCLSYIDGREPATWSRTITFGPGMSRAEREWLRHPQCGCGWAELGGAPGRARGRASGQQAG